MRFLLAMMVILALPACTSMLLGNTSSREPAPATTRNAAPSAADSAISGAIRRQLGEDQDLSKYAIGIRTSSGVVTLSGTVGSYPARDRAVQIASDVSGVRQVDNRLMVNTNL